MRFIRKSIIGKTFFLLFLLLAAVLAAWKYLDSASVTAISLDKVAYALIGILTIILSLFIWDIIQPIRRLSKEVTNLLTGKIYRRVVPTTIDEVGILTHFFNEITQDLEKISYDVKERRRMSSELDIASQIQKDVLPKETPEIPGLDIVAKTRSAAEVGGDVFDFLNAPDNKNTFIYIGDVTGHGVPSCLVMMMVETLITAMIYRGVDESRSIITYTNHLLYPRISTRLFMTSVMLRWDKENQKIYYTGAGHEHILVYRKATEEVEAITSGGIALGMIPDVSKIAQEKEIQFDVGDCIVLYSDGITEAKNKMGEMYGLEKIKASLKKNGYKPSVEGIFDGLTKDFSNFVQEYVQLDDITMIVIKNMGKDFVGQKVKLTISKDQVEEAMPKSRIWHWN